MPESKLTPLQYNVAITNPDGTPTPYFIQLLQQLYEEKALTDAAVANSIVAGAGLTGGGELADGPVTLSADVQAILNLVSSTRGVILYRGAAAWSALLPGAAGNVLQSNGAGADPSWVAAGGGGGGDKTLLQTQTVAGAASVVFDNTKITATYETYLLRFKNVAYSVPATGQVQLSPDNGVTWRTAGYNTSMIQWGLTTNFQSYAQNLLTSGLLVEWSAAGTDASLKTFGEIEIYGLMNAALKKLSMAREIGKASDANVYHRQYGGEWPTAEAINCIRYIPVTGTVSGTFELWGVS